MCVSYRLEPPPVEEPGRAAAVVTYGVIAQQDGSSPRSAPMSSTCVRRDDGWKPALHQPTPR